MRDPPPMIPTEIARVEIDGQLDACGWTVQDYQAISSGVCLRIALREMPLREDDCARAEFSGSFPTSQRTERHLCRLIYGPV